MLHKKKRDFKFLLLGLSIIMAYSLFLGIPKVYAATIYSPVYANSIPAQYEGAEKCPDLSRCNVGAECANSENDGNCGLPACSAGNAWTKYKVSNCYFNRIDTEGNIFCDQLYLNSDIVYSIGDKCYVPEQGLHSSSCFGDPSPSMYKTCCSYGAPSYVNPGSCVDFEGDTTNPPYEGRCPAGYQREVFCGGAGEPACGQEACGSAGEPPPPGPYCGDGSCNGSETTQSCPQDCPAPPPSASSCSVLWTLSDSNPPSNSTVNVTVGGTANPDWSGASYSLDGGSWTTAGSGPAFNFSVNSGSPGLHNLRFAINNGSTVCGDQNSQTFVTQSLNDASTCTAISVNSSNPVIAGQNYPATVSMKNDGTSTWTWNQPNPYRLGSQDPQDPPDPVWGLTRVDLPTSPIAPASTATFNFNVWAPSTAGTYTFNWRMVREGVHWFGSKCSYNVAVVPTFTPSCTGTVTDAATKTVRWNATVIPATPPTGSYTYLWSVDASGSTQSVTQTYSTAGTKNATVTVSNAGIQRQASCSVTITAPDLTVDSLSPAGAVAGDSVSFSGRVRNPGTGSAGASSTRLRYDSNRDGALDTTPVNQSTGTLAAGGSETETWPAVTFSTAGDYLFEICADIGGAVAESNETNNCAIATLIVSSAGTPAAPTVSTASLSCIPPGYTGSGVTITYGSRTPPVIWADISSSSTFSSYYHKDVSGTTSTTAPNGFNAFPGGSSLSLNPDTSYYVRVNNGARDSGVNSFSIPSCAAPTPAPTSIPGPGPTCGNSICEAGETTLSCPADCPPGGPVPAGSRPWIQTTGGDVHSNTRIYTPGGP